ncbi:hypothetical protein GCM10022223_67230 [Kineosporia mesophila]|uniref:Uncharacterized protein n=1 Tax=Kineosporia mesophila TaxID=566012 RepID=A0ABP7AS87_9ACTN
MENRSSRPTLLAVIALVASVFALAGLFVLNLPPVVALAVSLMLIAAASAAIGALAGELRVGQRRA